MIKVMEKPIEFGTYIHGLRKEKKYSLKIVADKEVLEPFYDVSIYRRSRVKN